MYRFSPDEDTELGRYMRNTGRPEVTTSAGTPPQTREAMAEILLTLYKWMDDPDVNLEDFVFRD